MKHFAFWQKYFFWLSIIFALQGCFWAIYGSFDPFGWYEGIMAQQFWGQQELPAAAKKTFSFLLAPFGATDAGFFILMAFIVKYPFANREPWAYWALLTALSFWFILDSSMSLYHAAYFNLLIVNIPSGILLLLPLLRLKNHFSAAD